MFESIVSKLVSTVLNAVRAVGESLRGNAWVAPVAIIAFFLIW